MRLLYALIATAVLVVQDASVEGKRWWSHIEFLASDALEGREIGTPGFDKAASYVESQFNEIGLKPGGTAGYRQPLKFETRLPVADQSKLALVRNGEEQPLAIGQDATISARSEGEAPIEAAMVFVGYGLSVPEGKWDDLAGLDLRGKIAVYVNVAAPIDIPDNVRSHVGSGVERWAVLRKAGAIGIATLPAPRPVTRPAQDVSTTAGAAPAGTGRGAAPAPQPIVQLADQDLREYSGLALSVTITRRGADVVLAGTGHTMAEIDQLVTEGKPLPRFALPGTLKAQAVIKRASIEATNVIGIHEGSDPTLKNEYVVMSAHLDHLGIGRAVNGDAIYNGAMDDASGVASVIEIARLLKESKVATKRSILFMAQAGEEEGLLGSKYFAARPTVPFETIVADVNLDMFLPLYPLKVIEVQGLTESSLGETMRAAARELGVDVQTDREPEQNRFIRSDQYSFIRNGIPSLAFKFGYESGSPEEKTRRDWVRDVYHKPNDDLKQPVDIAAAATFNRVILGLLQRVANDQTRPTWNETSFFKRFVK